MGDTEFKQHVIKNTCSVYGADTENRNVAEVVNLIQGLDSQTISKAATCYKDASDAVETAREAIRKEAVKLAEVWGGEAAVEAQTALGILYQTMGELSEKLKKMHSPIDNLATVVTRHQAFVNDPVKGIMSTWVPQGGLLGGTWNDSIPDFYATYTGYHNGDNATGKWGSPNHHAGQHLLIFTSDLDSVYRDIPESIQTGLRKISPPKPPAEEPTQIPYPSGTTGNTGGYTFPSNGGADLSGGRNSVGAVNGPDLGAYDPSTGFARTPGVDPNGSYPPGTTVPPGSTTPVGSTNPSGTDVPTYPGAGTPPSVGDTPGLNRDPSGDGAGSTTSLADYKPTTPGITSPTSTTSGYNTPTHPTTPGTYGTYGGTGTGGGVVPGQPTSLSTRAGTGVGGGMPFLPMSGAGGAGGGGESKDRESTTWLHEDDDVWGDDTGSVSSRIG